MYLKIIQKTQIENIPLFQANQDNSSPQVVLFSPYFHDFLFKYSSSQIKITSSSSYVCQKTFFIFSCNPGPN